MNNDYQRQILLIVDDEPGNIEVLIELLQPDYKIRVAKNGETALKIIFSEEPPDLILLDVVLPGIDGYEVCKRLKADPRSNKIPIIFITGKITEEDEIKGFEVGAVDYVTKPFNPIIVKVRVKTHAELKKHRDYIESQNLSDGLTGIPNRRRFDEYLKSIWDLGQRENSILSLILMDIDHFKKFNDNYGHIAGDECLKKVAQTLQATLRRKIDLIARYGGEEFVCVLPSTDLEGAAVIAEKFRQSIISIKIPHEFSSACEYISISAGVASIIPAGYIKPSDIIKAADEALYISKKNGRNRISVWNPDYH